MLSRVLVIQRYKQTPKLWDAAGTLSRPAAFCTHWQMVKKKKSPSFDTLLTWQGKRGRLQHLMEALRGPVEGGTLTSHCSRCVSERNITLWYAIPAHSPRRGAAQRREAGVQPCGLHGLTAGRHDSIRANQIRITDICQT